MSQSSSAFERRTILPLFVSLAHHLLCASTDALLTQDQLFSLEKN